MRGALVVLVMLPHLAGAQTLLTESFESPVSLVDAGGSWTDIFDVQASRDRSSVAAHRGLGGLRISRVTPIATDGPDTQLERLFPIPNAGPSWMRWWMRVDVSQPAPQALMNFGDVSVPNHIGLAHDPTGLFVTGYEATAGFFTTRVNDLPDSGWHLYELGVLGMGRSDGGVLLYVDGEQNLSRRADFDFVDAGRLQANLGFTYGSPRTFTGVVDYDDVRVSRDRPAGAIRIAAVNGPWRAGECIALRVDFSTSDRLVQKTAEEDRTLTFSATASIPVYTQPDCSQPSVVQLISSTTTSFLVFIRPMMAGAVRVQVNEPDLLGAQVLVPLLAPLDGGVDAGTLDAGAPPDAGSLDAGMQLDSGTPVDAGMPVDAGIEIDGGSSIDAGSELDAGTSFDAGRADSGTSVDAGPADAGMSVGPMDAGSGDGGVERELYDVGCGCRETGSSAWLLGVLFVFVLQRRVVR